MIDPLKPKGSPGRPAGRRAATITSAGRFSRSVERAQAERSLAPGAAPGLDLEELLDDLHSAGDRLKGIPGLSVIRDYRLAVQRFLALVVNRSYRITRSESPGLLHKRKRYAVIEVIDRKLEALAAQILAGQAEHLDIVTRVDELHGLLVDLIR